jgi:transcriptional regulator GlxA family with amidase domain
VPRRVLLVVFGRSATALDLAGPLDALHAAAVLRPGAYDVLVVAPRGEPVVTDSGLGLVPGGPLPGDVRGVDTIMVCAGPGADPGGADLDEVVRWVAASAGSVRRMASVCTGAFVLARAGLLDGRAATTHWDDCAALAAAHPQVRVEPDRIFVRDGSVATSAGVTAGIDLALAFVKEDLGADCRRGSRTTCGATSVSRRSPPARACRSGPPPACSRARWASRPRRTSRPSGSRRPAWRSRTPGRRSRGSPRRAASRRPRPSGAPSPPRRPHPSAYRERSRSAA